MAAVAARGGMVAVARGGMVAVARGGMAAVAVTVTAEVTTVTVAETAVTVGVIIPIGEAIIVIGGILLPEITGSPGDLALARNHPRRRGVGGDEGKTAVAGRWRGGCFVKTVSGVQPGAWPLVNHSYN
jgi:hypothetical protein